MPTSRRFFLFVAAGLLLAAGGPPITSVRADATSDARRAIQANYDKINAALAAKNVDASFVYQTSDFVATDAKGQKRTSAQLRAEITQIMPVMQSWRSASRIQKFSLRGDTATATVSETARLVLVNPQNGQKATMVSNGVSQDTWVRQNGAWRMKRSRLISSKSTVNGKPAPGG